MNARLLLPLGAAVFLSACATMPPPEMAVETASRGQLITGADCVVSTPGGSWHVSTPGSAPVGRANGAGSYLRVMCSKAGFRDTELQASPVAYYRPGRFNSVYFGMSRYYGAWPHSSVGWGGRFGSPMYYDEDGPDRWDYPRRVMVDMAPLP